MATRPSRRASDKTAQASQAPVVTLVSIVAATIAGSFVYASPDAVAEMLAAGFVEQNPTMANEAGELATRATEAGIAQAQGNTVTPNDNAAANAGTPSNASSGFEIDDGIAPPEVKRGRQGGDTLYPFDKLGVGQSFHVAVSGDKPEPWKSLASTVSSATERYRIASADGATETVKVTTWKRDGEGKRVKDAEGKFIAESVAEVTRPKMIDTRKFIVREVGAGDPKGKGARVFRTA